MPLAANVNICTGGAGRCSTRPFSNLRLDAGHYRQGGRDSHRPFWYDQSRRRDLRIHFRQNTTVGHGRSQPACGRRWHLLYPSSLVQDQQAGGDQICSLRTMGRMGLSFSRVFSLCELTVLSLS